MPLLKPTRRPRVLISSGPNTSPKIKVLVCTANIGNEAPNEESIEEWIPEDGLTKQVLQNQPYPLKENNNRASDLPFGLESPSSSGESKDGSSNDDDEKFQVIAIGMQEATFDLEDSTKFGQTFQKVTAVVEQATKNTNYHKDKNKFDVARDKLVTKTEELFSHFDDGWKPIPEEGSSSNRTSRMSFSGQNIDTRLLHEMLSNRLPSYTRAVSYQRGQMRLMIFYREDDISLDVLDVKAQNTGRGGLANKGGIVAECDINGGTRISFLTAHLEAHEGLAKYNMRCSTIGDIFRGTASSLVDSYCDVSMTSHFMFAMGDLNFRTRLPNYEMGSEKHLKASHELAREKDWDTLNEHDELSLALKNKDCLVGFLTPPCNFPPTFKVERRAGYTYIPKRSPSYTDRILYKENHNLSKMIQTLAYEPIDHFTTSDHKPIRGAYEIQLNKALTFRPILTRKYKSSRFFQGMNTSMVFNKFKSFRKTNTDPGSIGTSNKAHSENFHFFLSSIECEIAKESSSLNPPSPCVSFVSTPTKAMMVKSKKKNWKLWYKKNSAKLGILDVKDSGAIEWPHTESISNTFEPHWKNEVNFKIRTHLSCGTPVNLTGAMLHILVHDTKDKLNLIGSCTLNLASLVIASREKPSFQNSSVLSSLSQASRWLRKTRSRHSSHSKKASTTKIEYGDIKDPFQFSASNGGVSTNAQSNIENHHQPSLATSVNSFEHPFGHHDYTVNEILMKNGKEVGRIKFNMDTWWLNDDDFAYLSERKIKSTRR